MVRGNAHCCTELKPWNASILSKMAKGLLGGLKWVHILVDYVEL